MKKIMLYLSAFVPLYFLVILKIIVDIIFGNLHFNVLNTLTLILLLGAIIIGVVGAVISIKHNNTPITKVKIIKTKSITQQYFLGYFSLFVLFALSYELEKVSMFIVFIVIIVLIGIVYIKNDLFYINPFLNILGYNFYDATFEDENGNFHKNIKFVYKGKLDNLSENFSAKLSHENFSILLKND